MKKENAKDFFAWCDKKGLTRNDLIYILDSIELNRDAFQNTSDAIRGGDSNGQAREIRKSI